MTQEGVEGGKAGSGVFVSHPCVVENQHLMINNHDDDEDDDDRNNNDDDDGNDDNDQCHLDSTGSIAFCKPLQVFCMFGVWLKGHRTNLLI